MNNVLAFARRGVTLFLRDRAAVFFSFLSALILIALYFLFIGKSYADGVMAAACGALSEGDVYALVYVQMIAGVLTINTLSVSVGVFLVVARDFETRRVDSFLLTPLRPHALLASYFLSGFLVSYGLCILTWGASAVAIGTLYGYWASPAAFLGVSGILAIASFISCSIMLLFTALVRSSAAIGVFSGVAGTFLGFVCGIYIPYAELGEGIKTFGTALPFTHIAIWLKQAVVGDACAELGLGEAVEAVMLEGFSAEGFGLGAAEVGLPGALAYSCAVAVVCSVCAWGVIGRRLAAR